MAAECPVCSAVLPAGGNCPTCEGIAPASAVNTPEPLAAAATHAVAAPTFASISDADLEGLSGWLILVGISLVVSPLLTLNAALNLDLRFFLNPRFQAYRATHHGVEALVMFELITNLVLTAAVFGLNYLFFTRRKTFPTYMIAYLVTGFAIGLADTVATHISIPNAPPGAGYVTLARALISAAIWVPYFLVSRRVKATFIH
jgi:hypothetical protein